MTAGRAKGRTWLGVWKDLDATTKRQIAEASFEHEKVGKAAVLALARHDRVRRQTVEKWPVEKRAEHFARMRRLPSAQLAAAMLTHFHLVRRKRLVVSFLDFLKIPHEDGLIEHIEDLEPPVRSRTIAAIRRMSATFPRAQVQLFLDVISCQSSFEVFSDFDAARVEALGDASLVAKPKVAPVTDTFGGQLDNDFTDEPAEAEREPAPPQDDTPPTFTTLDQVLMRTVIASVADVHGALPTEKVEDLVEEVVQLNLERHQSYFHRGFLAVLLGREVELDFREASDARRGWYACGAIIGYKRRGDLVAVVDLLTKRPELARELARPGSGYAEQTVSIVFEAYCATSRFAEAARFLSPAVVGRAGVPLAREILEVASGLIRERREADARRLLDALLAALPTLAEDPDLPDDFAVLLQRRRAHCARLRGDFEGARKLLEPQLEAADPSVRSDILADLGLIECGLRSLADVRIPPEEEVLSDFAKQFDKGWKLFERSSRVAAGGRNHGDFCIGMALFARGDTSEAITFLERAVAGMSADPERYGRFGPLESARLALAVALAEQTDLARMPYARDLLRQVLESRSRAPEYMLRRALVAFELTDTDVAIELAHEIHAALGSKSLEVLAETRMIRFVPGAIDELLAISKKSEHSAKRRWEAASVVLRESHAMRDAPGEEGPAAFRERATEALDVMIELAGEEPMRSQMIDLLGDEDGPWRAAMEPIDARVVRATLYEAQGQFANAANELSRAVHATLDVDDEWALGKAEALIDDIRALVGDDAVVGLEARYQQYKEVVERRSQSGLVVPPSVDPADFYGLILVVGGNETQQAQDEAIAIAIKAQWPNVTLLFERTGWNSNWGDQLRAMEGELTRARAVVIMRYVRTMLGKNLRKRCGELELPWVACTGSGRASTMRAIEQAILLAWRQSGMAAAGQ
jgi:tetratricopeptide (TPR) repeat protein